ncbi:uncharacterized protein LOC125940409 [Dermacentor silvarum]|uniref:uncharacterized protein LOC125940409 n=1 Tax=Dermacentor silvarum TaxID=543639 RepID=UPI002101573E|nr:uncharacterized protein LOC125940409 [Dermacentor silvarum]
MPDGLIKRCRLQRMPGAGGSSPAALREARRKSFLKASAVQHVRTRPYHLASNGAAERLVQTVKRNLIRQLHDEQRAEETRTVQQRLDQFLFTYLNTLCYPSCFLTGKTPAESFLSWASRTVLGILHQELAKRPEPIPAQHQGQGQKKKKNAERVWLQETMFV